MKDIKSSKEKQLNSIVSIVKIISLLLLGIILCKYIFSKTAVESTDPQSMITLNIAILPLLFLVLIYFIWTFSTSKKFNNKYKNVVQSSETILFIILFTTVILFFGQYQSEYKILYLFLVITATIQEGMKKGLIVAGISSMIILSLDLIFDYQNNINPYFEKDLILCAVFIITAWILGFYVRIEKEYVDYLEEMVNKDGLTEVYNHRFFFDNLKKIINRKNYLNTQTSLIFLDIDHFKHYNDMYGHQEGDYVLKKIASIISQNVRQDDIVARYGGEEFSVILPNTSEKEGIEIAEKIRKIIEETYFKGEENQPNGKLTVSIGVSVYPDKAKDDLELIKSADDALYRAKFFSKNRVEAYTSVLDEITGNIDQKDIELVTSIKTLISIINAKDKYTYGHVERVVIYSRIIAEELNLSQKERETLIYGAYMHDIGKINIDESVLCKKMKLTNDEWEQLKKHPENGAEIIRPVKALQDIIPLIISHHERYDGKGYPYGLKGEEIPYLARILTVIDSFDAMTSNRPYNSRKTLEEGVEELRKCCGTQFDGKVVEAFVRALKKSGNFKEF